MSTVGLHQPRKPHKPHHPHNDVPDEMAPGALPVEPDEGPNSAFLPDDPEQDGVIDSPI